VKGIPIIVDANWKNLMKEIKEIRFQVFVREQGVPPELEVDGSDPLCLHVLAEIPGKGFIGTARLLPDGHIGRVAVLAEYRRKGIGREMVLHLIQLARSLRHRQVMLNAQESALEFYSRMGFIQEGDRFFDAGIPHFLMRMDLFAKG